MPGDAVDGWETLASEAAFQQRVTVMRDRLRTPRGAEMDYIWVASADAAAVLAFTADGSVILTQQYRHPLRRTILDLPAGGVHPGETPEQAAQRELREETGHLAGELQPLGKFYPAPGMMSYCVHVFVANELQPGEPAHDEHELVEVVTLPWGILLERVIHNDEALDVTLAFAVLRYAAQSRPQTQARS